MNQSMEVLYIGPKETEKYLWAVDKICESNRFICIKARGINHIGKAVMISEIVLKKSKFELIRKEINIYSEEYTNQDTNQKGIATVIELYLENLGKRDETDA